MLISLFQLPGLQKPLSVFIRLEKPLVFADLPEVNISSSSSLPPSTQVDIATKFLYILVSPTDSARAAGCTETGRAAGTAFSDRLVGWLGWTMTQMFSGPFQSPQHM